MKDQNTNQLFKQVNDLHAANIESAERTSENAIRIGILLLQIKETVGHGEFGAAMEKECPTIVDRTCRNYMALVSERLIEHKARLLIPDTKSETVSDLPHGGQNPLSPAVVSVPLPENAIPSEAWDQASKEVQEMSWLDLPEQTAAALTKNLSGKSITELYRDYGICRQKEPKVYHAPKPQTPDDKIAAENAQALALVDAAEQQLNVLFNDLQSKTGILSTRIPPKRWKEFLRHAVAATKAIRPLTKRKASPAEKKADNQAKAKALVNAIESCQTTMAKSQPATTEALVTCPICHQENFSVRGLKSHICRANDRKRLTPVQINAATIQSPVRA